MLKRFSSRAALALAATGLAGSAIAAELSPMPVDQPVTVDGVDLACTGIGDEAQSDPRWQNYPVRMEFAGGNAQYLADVDVTVKDANGKSLFTVRCDSAWLLANLAPGKYVVEGKFRDLMKSSKFNAPKAGQARIIVRFPEIVGNGDN